MLSALRHMAPIGLAASCGVGTQRLQRPAPVRVHTPVTRCSLRLSTRAGRRVGGDPISPTAGFARPEDNGPPPPAPRPKPDSAPKNRFHLFADGALREYPGLEERPQRHEQLPRHRHIPIRLRRLPPPPKRSRNQPRGHSQAGNVPNSRPTLWPSSAHAGSLTGSSLVPGCFLRCDTASGIDPAQPPTSRRFFNARPPKNSLTQQPRPIDANASAAASIDAPSR